MKFNPNVSSSRRKSRKAHFTADSNSRRKIMSARLEKDEAEKYGIKSIPIRKDDEVKIVRGKKKLTDGKVTGVFRKKYVIFIDRVTRSKVNGQEKPIPIHPSNVVITKLHMDSSRQRIIDRKAAGRSRALAALKGE